MGSPLGVFDDEEIADLSEGERKQLREAIVLVLRDQSVLKDFLDQAQNAQIRQTLRQEVANNFQHTSKLRLKP